jgi:hypothetical protein
MEVEDYGLKKSMLCPTLAHPAYKHLNGIAFYFKVVYWRVIIRPSKSSSDNYPPVFRDMPVPEVLLSGKHREIWRWRRKEALRRTLERRPELLEKIRLSEEDHRLMSELRRE